MDNYQEDTPLRTSLVKYSALLHYTKLSHGTLEYLYSHKSQTPYRFMALPWHLFQSILFIPPLFSYAPSYLLSYLSGKYIAQKGEEEGQAQYKAVIGGVGLGVHWAILSKLFGGRALDWSVNIAKKWAHESVAGVLERVRDGGRTGKLVLLFGLGYLMVKWHNLLVKGLWA